MSNRIGVQLYTVRERLGTSGEAMRTMEAIRAIGYDCVQLFGSTEMLKAQAQAADACGLEAIGLVTVLEACRTGGRELLELCRSCRIGDIAISSELKECRDTEAYIREVNSFAAVAAEEGFTFSYHNHGHEFMRLDSGERIMDRFLRDFDPINVKFMPDTYWIQDGGYDVRRFLEQVGERMSMLHLKDMKRIGGGHTFAPVGGGNLYFEGIIACARAHGVRTFVVEQDICEDDPLDCLRQSYDHVKKLLEV